MKQYLALFELGEKSVGVVFPDLPNVITTGKNYEQAFKNAILALSFYAEEEKLPKESSLEEIRKNWQDWELWKNKYNFIASYVPVISNKTKTKRINITLSESLISHLDAVTDNRSGFIEQTLRNCLVA